MDTVLVIETVFTTLLLAAIASITYVSGVVVYKLFKGQN